MHYIISDRMRQVCLAGLEVIVFLLYLAGIFVDLSFLDLWQYWLGLVFFWLVVLLLAASWQMFSQHRILAVLGLALVALIFASAVFSIPHAGKM